jgi:pilus assembly protein Flp/PilA
MNRDPARLAALPDPVGDARAAQGLSGRNFAARALASLQRFLQDESGPTAVEYALMLSLVMVFCMAGVRTLGSHISGAHARIANSIAAEGSGDTAADAGGIGRGLEGKAKEGGKKDSGNTSNTGAQGGQRTTR